MFLPFFALAAQSPGRQRTFRRVVVAHLAALCGAVWALSRDGAPGAGALLGHVVLLAAVVEGAVLLGWRLTQLPRSQALEFLLVSPLHPQRVFLAEALVGLGRLALVTLSGLPVLAVLVACGCVQPLAVVPLVVMPFTWGGVTGLGLVVWAYEPLGVRRWGERLALAGIISYLVVGVLAGERLQDWAATLTGGDGAWLASAVGAWLTYNPFGALKSFLIEGEAAAWGRCLAIEMAGLALLGLLLLRGTGRLLPHFHDRHHQPAIDRSGTVRARVGDAPLTWWTVKRVTQYSGRINLWLAGGFTILYALYTLAGSSWPHWLGRRVFEVCDDAGGIPGLATALTVLGAVPAAFQYGLWDSNVQERCRRLELLLLTRLGAADYWNAASAAAWHRGQGYLGLALVLWGTALGTGQVSGLQAAAALASGVLLWCLYFSLGFRAFSRGLESNGLGLFLTIGLPLSAYCAERGGIAVLSALLPPGNVYAAAARAPGLLWAIGPVVAGIITLLLTRRALTCCEPELRLWYERHHGRKVMC
jgi:hypothetical protein